MIEYWTYSNVKSVGLFSSTAHGAPEPEQYWFSYCIGRQPTVQQFC
jgi:hypothetical protein